MASEPTGDIKVMLARSLEPALLKAAADLRLRSHTAYITHVVEAALREGGYIPPRKPEITPRRRKEG